MNEDDWEKVSKWHFAIAGVRTSADEVEVTPGVVIRRLREFPTRKLMSDCIDNDLVVGLMQHYAINHSIEHELIIDAELLDDPIPARELAMNVIAGIRIRTEAESFCPAACEHSWMDFGSVAKKPCKAALMENAMYSHVSETPKTITDDDLDWLNENLSAMSDLNLDDRYVIAFRALVTYMHAADYRMMAAQIWGGIESLIKARDHVSYSLSLWAALYLEPRGPNCGLKQKTIRKLYDKRSDVIHGREINEHELKAHVENARRLLGELLAKVIQATQPKEWYKFIKQHGESARQAFLKRVAQAVEADGIVTVLRQGVKANGCKFKLAAFQPESSRNPETEKLFQANQFSVIRQVRYSEKTDHSLDVVLFLNGLPLFTVELKNPLNGQDVRDAITQYKRTRDPRETLFVHGHCVAHFAVDPFYVYMTTQLKGKDTFFLPFNIGRGEGKNKGAGNPPPKLGDGFSTSYMWKDVWTKDRVLELMQYFVQDIRDRDQSGKLRRVVIFPRYHQLSAVRALVADARENGTGQDYLIQHSAGSGKSNSIAWLAHRLSSLQADDTRVFDSVIVVTDRVALDRQLSQTVSSFEQTAGLVEHVESGRELMEALESGKQVIITTLQKFPVVLEHVRKMEDEWRKAQADPEIPKPKFYKPEGHRFALILDEAHSSQGGEASKEMRQTLHDVDDDTISPAEMAAADQEARGKLSHVSTFAFTATPKERTLELFGRKNPNPGAGEPEFVPFDLYSMRQAIEEEFILDVLQNYVSYHVSWTLTKKIKEDPSYDPNKASKLLTRFVNEEPKTIREKVAIICEHLDSKVLDEINGRARAMLVTSSRQSAVTFKLEVDEYLKQQGLKWKAIVAFSGTVTDEDSKKEYTENSLNGFPDAQTAAKFETDPYRLLIVANKFQTGFDQPLLHTMYVDKTLTGVAAVQTLSRLNRTMKDKDETCVLDFVTGNPDRVKEAFSRYYGETSLKSATDPNDLYKIEAKLKQHGFFFPADVEAFTKVFYVARPSQDKVYAVLKPIVDRVESATEDEQKQFRTNLGKFVDSYAFLGQIISFTDVDLEQLFQFSRYLLRIVPVPKEDQPRELKRYVEVDTIKLRRSKVEVYPEKDKGTLEVKEDGGSGQPPEPPLPEPLSEILKRLNERFGTDITGPAAEEFIETLEGKLNEDAGLAASFAVNTPENARLTFDNKVRDHVQDMIDTNFKFYKQINDKPEFADFLNDLLFDRYSERKTKDNRE